ncbi:MAG TPA: hypothetical protein VFM18_22570 [Methanosarcina sp.]|nr:hypothetical protein [Methanosarcina sp.]
MDEQGFVLIIHPEKNIGRVVKTKRSGSDDRMSFDEDLMVALDKKIKSLESELQLLRSSDCSGHSDGVHRADIDGSCIGCGAKYGC